MKNDNEPRISNLAVYAKQYLRKRKFISQSPKKPMNFEMLNEFWYSDVIKGEIRIRNCKAVVALRDEIVTIADIDRVLEAAVPILCFPANEKVVCVIPQEFSVDDQNGILKPFGMLGSRLEVIVRVILVTT